MSATSQANAGPPAPAPLSPLQRVSAALVYGGGITATCFILELVFFALLCGGVPLHLLRRLALLAGAGGAAAALAYGIWGRGTTQQSPQSFRSGSWRVGLGLLLGVLLAGYVGERSRLSEIPDTLELAGPTLDGGRFDLAQQRGKVVLVDFWATWCAPCRAELPKVQAIYDKYHESGLEVVGVSLDEDRADLVKFLQARPLPWPQIFFNEQGSRGFNSPLARTYSVQAIPCVLLFDREGKLLGRDLYGAQLESALAGVLGRPLSWEERGAALNEWLAAFLVGSVSTCPWWLLLVCGLGGTTVVALVEVALRRAWRRPPVSNGNAAAP